MQYDCGDILFDFFFRGDYSITWSSTSGDLRLNVGSAGEADHDFGLAVAANQDAGSGLRLAVESSIAVLADIAFDVKAISVSAICLGVECSGWSGSRLALRVTEQNAAASHQILFNVREEDWFTN